MAVDQTIGLAVVEGVEAMMHKYFAGAFRDHPAADERTDHACREFVDMASQESGDRL